MINDLRPPYRIAFDNARDPYAARNALGIAATGGPPAPANAQYITAASDATLTAERVATNTATVTWDFATAGQAKANVVAGSFGDVFLAANNAFTGTNSFAATTTLYSTTSFRSTVALPANGVDIVPTVTTGIPSINAIGIDTNIALAIKGKGTGVIDFYGQGVRQAQIGNVAGASTYVRIRGAVGQGILDAVGGGYLNIIDANLSSGASGGAISVTPALSDSSTKVATTAFVQGVLPAAHVWTAYTPSISAVSGAFTTVSATGKFLTIGKLTHVQITITITTNGSAAAAIMATLPNTPVGQAAFAGRENLATGKMVQGRVQGSDMIIWNYDNTYPGASGGSIIISGTYENT